MKRPTNIKLSKEAKIQVQKKSELKFPDLQKGEIALVLIHYKNKDGNSRIEMVYKRPSDCEDLFCEYQASVFKRRTKSSVEKITQMELIKRLGFESKTKSFSLAVKSEEKRDSKTGKYD